VVVEVRRRTSVWHRTPVEHQPGGEVFLIVSLSCFTKLQGGFFPEGFVGRINRNTNYDKLADGYEVHSCNGQNPTVATSCCRYACCSEDCQGLLQKLLWLTCVSRFWLLSAGVSISRNSGHCGAPANVTDNIQ
jgi:hypothetical protein